MVRRFRMYLSLFLLLDLVAAGAIFYYNCKEGIPDEIWVEEGKKNIDLPFGCNVKKGEKTVDALSNTSKDYEIPVELFYCIPVKTIHAKAAEKVQVAPAGEPIGIYVETKGLLVLDTAEIPGKDGMTYAPAHNLLKTGDYILQWNHIVVSTIKQLNQEIQKTGNKKVPVKIRRNSEEMEVAIRPIRSSDNKFRIGTWVREDTQGIGTLTYVTSNGKFGTLGHGISDIDTKMLLKLRGGEVYKSQIIGIQKKA
ncbi:MAG: SpoIVB peptidase, partial [Eubacterium sp.]|nr:SpoIVB peptidase [Eubacterium sp.]